MIDTQNAISFTDVVPPLIRSPGDSITSSGVPFLATVDLFIYEYTKKLH